MPESCTTGTRGTPKANNTGKLYTLGKEDNEFNVHFPSYILQQLRETSSKPSFFSLSKNCKVYLCNSDCEVRGRGCGARGFYGCARCHSEVEVRGAL